MADAAEKKEAQKAPPTLEILSGNNKGSHYTLGAETLYIGRGSDNDIVLDDKRVSRHHAQISYENGLYFISDLNTANGTLVNRHRILNQQLQTGDIVQIGDHAFRFFHNLGDQPLSKAKVDGAPPQQEIITPRSPSAPKSFSLRPFLYGGMFLFLTFFIWVMMQPSKPPSSPEESSKSTSSSGPTSAKDLPEVSKEAYSINWEKANHFYLSGYRELLSKNYLRAVDDFKTALELYPEHRLARLYLKKAEDSITEDVLASYKAGINYFNSAQYTLAIHHFRQVMTLLKYRKPPEGFCAVRAEQKHTLDNPDFEKYCESEQKISEAQARISLGHGF